MNPIPLIAVADPSEGVSVTASTYFRHLCPHKDEADEGRVTVSWMVADKTIELHSLAAYFRGWASVKISNENLTTAICDDLAKAGVYEITVKTTWQTAGMEITTEVSA